MPWWCHGGGETVWAVLGQPRPYCTAVRHEVVITGGGNEFGGGQFSTFKKALAEVAVGKLAPITTEMNRLLSDPAEIDRILGDGARRASAIASPILAEIKDILGFVRAAK